MDAFYASIEQRDKPELQGRPVIVGGSSDRGVVSTASYEARKFGVHSAMPGIIARRLCPHGVFVRPRMQVYSAISQQVLEIFRSFTPLVEPISLDEAFLDVSGSLRLFGSARSIANRIRAQILRETQLTASVGIARSKFIAKIASDLEKPNGVVEVKPGTEEAFLSPLPISKMWGVGPEAAKRLAKLNLINFGDLAKCDETKLHDALGKWGARIRELAKGSDLRKVIPDHRASSLGCENTFHKDLTETQQIRRELLGQVERVGRRLRRRSCQAERVSIKIKLGRERNAKGRYRVLSRSLTLPHPTSADETLFSACLALLDRCRLLGNPVRLTGVSVSRLSPRGSGQLSLLEEQKTEKNRFDRLAESLDRITQRFGPSAIRRGPRTTWDKQSEDRGSGSWEPEGDRKA